MLQPIFDIIFAVEERFGRQWFSAQKRTKVSAKIVFPISYLDVMKGSTRDSRSVKAVALILLAFLMLASVGILIKLQLKSGVSVEWIVFVQYLSCLTMTLIISSFKKFSVLWTSKIKFHIIRGIAGVLAFSCFAFAISKIPLVNASLLNNTSPIFIPIMTFLWFRVKIDKNIWWGISVGFIGIIFILDPSASEFLKTGDLFGLASGIFMSIAYVALGVLTKTESFLTILFYYSLISVLIFLPLALNNWADPPMIVWVYAISTGILFFCYVYFHQFAYKFLSAVKLSPLNFSVVVFTGLLDWFVFDSVPNLLSVVGIILVITGGILAIVLHERDSKELKHHWH
jgi:drug/metabolite transporter (DMT)-like permease